MIEVDLDNIQDLERMFAAVLLSIKIALPTINSSSLLEVVEGAELCAGHMNQLVELAREELKRRGVSDGEVKA